MLGRRKTIGSLFLGKFKNMKQPLKELKIIDSPVEQILEQKIIDILKLIGENPNREGLQETPKRVSKAYAEWFKGYTNPPTYKLFDSKYKGILARKAIPFISHCEHHIAIYNGFIDFGYIPNGKVTGISKIIRRFQHLSARLTIQENLTDLLIDDFIKEVSVV